MNGVERGELEALRAEVRLLTSTVDKLVTRFDAQSASQVDHESRLRSLERWKAALPLSTFVTMATLAVGLFALLSRGGA